MHRSQISRRHLLLGLSSLAGATSLAMVTQRPPNQTHLSSNLQSDFPVNGNAPLKDRAAAKGLLFGAFPSLWPMQFPQQNHLQAALIQENGLMVMGVGWGETQPTPETHDFTRSDSFAEFAERHQMRFRGHPLIWHIYLPDWLSAQLADSTQSTPHLENILVNHASKLVTHYANRIHSWDVVNEAINPEDGRPDGLRKTPWLERLGPQYIDLAFHAAAAADPNALLVYNDYEMEYDTPVCEAKRTAVLKFLERLKAQGTPVGALGMQSHLLGHEQRFNPNILRTFLKDVASLGLKILITELDVQDYNFPADIPARDRAVADVYEKYLTTVLDEPAVIAVTTWGHSDYFSWLSEQAPRPDGLPVRPLPLDAEMNRKLAWNAIARAIDACPPRS
jgi:endo-1,4-beta-xylanase